MKIRIFVFGLGFGLMILSVLIYFFYSFQIRDGNVEEKNVVLSDAEVIERARQLGMLTITEALGRGSQNRISDDEIIELASELGMVFPENEEAQPGQGRVGSGAESDMPYDNPPVDSDITDLDENAGGPEDSVVGGISQEPVETGRRGEDITEPTEPASLDDNTGSGLAGINNMQVSVPESEEETGQEEGIGDGQFILVRIPQGASANEISVRLYNAGVIGDSGDFLRYLIMNNLTKKITFGSFYFYPDEAYESILEKISLNTEVN